LCKFYFIWDKRKDLNISKDIMRKSELNEKSGATGVKPDNVVAVPGNCKPKCGFSQRDAFTLSVPDLYLSLV